MNKRCTVLALNLQAVCEPAAGMCCPVHTGRFMGLQAKQGVCLLHASIAQCTSDGIESQQLSFFKSVFKLSLKYIRGLCRYSSVDHVCQHNRVQLQLRQLISAFWL